MNIRSLLLHVALSLSTFPGATNGWAATIIVNSTADDPDAHDINPGNGVCADSFLQCPLRAAIEETNALPGADRIEFSVGGNIGVAALVGALPAITDRLDIDGTTAPAYPGANLNLENAAPVVYISGSAVGGAGGSAKGLRFLGSGAAFSSVRAMGIVNFSTGIDMGNGANNLFVDLCYVGLLANGAAAGNSLGIFAGTSNNVIGRYLSGFGNVISGNIDAGVALGIGTGNIISGNRIGTTPEGISARGNGIGIAGLGANGNSIGVFYGNVVSGNLGNAIQIAGSSNQISANKIGIAINGAARGNGGIGISVQGADNVIGSGVAAGANTIANNTQGVFVSGDGNTVVGNQIGVTAFSQGNSGDGIHINAGSGNNIIDNRILNSGDDAIDVSGAGTLIQGNVMGFANFAVGGIQNFGNDGNGINLRASASSASISDNTVGFSRLDGISLGTDSSDISGNFIGVTSDGAHIGNDGYGIGLNYGSAQSNTLSLNRIAFNGRAGVGLFLDVLNDNAIFQNSIFSNGGIGIDLRDNGPTANDAGDPDTGPNKMQNYPEILSVVPDNPQSPTVLNVQWRIDSTTVNSTYGIYADFYLADSFASGEGKVYLAYAIAHAPGVINTTLPLPVGTTGGSLVATATDNNGIGSTSEFSPPIAFGNPDLIFADGFEMP